MWVRVWVRVRVRVRVRLRVSPNPNQRGGGLHLEEPRLECLVDDDVVAEQLEAASVVGDVGGDGEEGEVDDGTYAQPQQRRVERVVLVRGRVGVGVRARVRLGVRDGVGFRVRVRVRIRR